MSKITSMFSGTNGMSADLIKAAAQVSAESSRQAAQEAGAGKAALANKFESFRPLSADKVDNAPRPIERLYAGMMPNKVEVQKEETIAERVAAMKKPVAEQTHPKTDKEKSLAALAHPKDKITHKDVMVGRGVIAKEEAEPKQKTGTNPFDWKNYKSQVKRKPGELTGHDSKKISTGTVYTKKPVDEAAEGSKDTPGQEHICAVHVKHAKLGEGRTLTSQHAEPAEDGSIAWYDVMFAEGISRVDTEELEILVSESHMNHKKKK